VEGVIAMTHTVRRQPKVLREGVEVQAFPEPQHRWVLWHVTGNCNFECIYCYGSFEGKSYKATYDPKLDVPIEYLLRAADDIASLGFNYVHINGGEPFMRRDIWRLIERLYYLGVQPFLLTNASFLPARFEENFSQGWLKNLAFSLDALAPLYNDYVRSDTEQVIANIETIANLKARHNVDTELGLYVVLTRLNIDLVPPLLDWARSVGIGYINVQAVYLPEHHPRHAELSLTAQERLAALSLLEQLRGMRSDIRTSSDVLISLTDHLLAGGNVAVRDCFCGQDFLFIDWKGNIVGCPCGLPSARQSLGNIRERSLMQILEDNGRSAHADDGEVCPITTLDCLGMYEMAYMEF
jgi:MoaA/NifB/PqqE/SkfB family radical SAM enzyme